MSTPATGLPEHLTVVAWSDPIVETHGYPPEDPYIAWCWLPILGPTATWLYRRLEPFTHLPPTPLPAVDIFASIGIGTDRRPGRHNPGAKALSRLVDFNIARALQPGTIALRQALPPLPLRRLERLPKLSLAYHHRATQTRPGPTTRP